jgi:hypothetical protein
MLCFNGACKNLGEKRLIGHVGSRIYQNDFRLIAPLGLSFESQGRIKSRVSSAYDDNSLHVSPYRDKQKLAARTETCCVS